MSEKTTYTEINEWESSSYNLSDIITDFREKCFDKNIRLDTFGFFLFNLAFLGERGATQADTQ